VVRDCVPRAMDKHSDLGFEGVQPGTDGVSLPGNPTLLKEMVRNLVDNAINYTPSSAEKPGVITARVLVDPYRIGRVIARPFVGQLGAFRRTSHRHDYALEPPTLTLLDHLTAAGHPVIAVGKIKDLFAGRGITRHLASASDDEGMDRVDEALRDVPRGLIWANLVDFDALYGHRNNVDGYARNLERFDARLADLLPHLRSTDLLVVTADHGNDPTTPSTDHSREYVPLLATGATVLADVSLGTRATFADLGQTIAANFAVGPLDHGTSFLEALGGSFEARPFA